MQTGGKCVRCVPSSRRTVVPLLQHEVESGKSVWSLRILTSHPLYMTDVFTPQQRSWLMSRVRQRDTTPEQRVRGALHLRGFRFTINGPKNKRLPGRPDIVFPKYNAVVFVHGCFWHGHTHCPLSRLPKQRRAWWKKKFNENRARDRRAEKALQKLGWSVFTIWQCDIKNASTLTSTIDRLAERLSRAAP
jgi:DNA mismatch endonuclease (patch repair protein)